MQTLKRILAGGFVFSVLLTAGVQAADDLDALRGALERNHNTQAWALAEKLEPQRAGDPDFDYLYAQAALAAKQPSRAIFALERVRLQRPSDAQAQLLLVRAQLAAGDSIRAQRELDAVLASTASGTVRREAQMLAKQLVPPVARHPARGFIGLDFGYDSNVNSATDAVSITGIAGNPSVGVVLAPDDRAQADSFARVSAGYAGRYRLASRTSLFAAAYGYANVLYDQPQFNTSFYQARVGGSWQTGRHRVAIPLSRQVFNLDHGRYSISDTVGLEWTYTINPAQQLLLGASRGLARYIDQPTRDGRFTSALVGWSMQTGRAGLGANVRYGVEDPRVDFNETLAQSNAFMGRQSSALGLDVSYRLWPGHMPRLGW